MGRDGIGPTAVNYPGPDFGEGDGVPTSGIDATGNDTGLPGEPNIDKTDVDESDQIGLSSFYYFAPANQIELGNDSELWLNLAPGFFDVPPGWSVAKTETSFTGRAIFHCWLRRRRGSHSHWFTAEERVEAETMTWMIS